MKLSPHFTLEEFTTTKLKGVDNTPAPSHLENLKRLASMMESVRTYLGHPIHVNSAYRSQAVNSRIGGSKNSSHMRGLAIDFICPSFGTPLQICQEILKRNVEFDQLINEGTWIHFSIPELGVPPRRDILTAHFEKGKPTTYTRGIG